MSVAKDSVRFEVDERIPAGNPNHCELIGVETFAVDDDEDDFDWEELAREAHFNAR